MKALASEVRLSTSVGKAGYSRTQAGRVTSFETAAVHAADNMLYLIAIAIAMGIDHRPSNLNFPRTRWSFLMKEETPRWRAN
jgi:hypothetical protein